MIKKGFKDIMQGRILSGELKPGDKLPPERELAAEMGISRGSVNQGLLDLERMGFIRIVPRKGAYVADYMTGASPEILVAIMSYDTGLIGPDLFRDLMEMRILVEKECAKLAAQKINAEAIRELYSISDRIHDAKGSELTAALFEFHACVARISGNKAYALLFISFEKMIRRLIEVHYSSPEELRNTLPLYHELAQAISRGYAEEAQTLMGKILGSAASYLNQIL